MTTGSIYRCRHTLLYSKVHVSNRLNAINNNLSWSQIKNKKSASVIFHQQQQTTLHPSTILLVSTFASSSSSSSSSSNNTATKQQLRVAIVGGGVGGLSTALHLAPLVERGIIAKPIDLYEKSTIYPNNSNEKNLNPSTVDEFYHPGTGSLGRDIGVGIWSTALEPFVSSIHSTTSTTNLEDASDDNEKTPRDTHLQFIQDIERMGQYVGEVGYRTPDGHWLTRSTLDSSGFLKPPLDTNDDESASSSSTTTTRINSTNQDHHDPALLFIREKDFLSALKNAVMKEQNIYGNIQTHYASSDDDLQTTVTSITVPPSSSQLTSGLLEFANNTTSSPSTPYHVIIAADGMNSTLRSKYAGHESLSRQWKQATQSDDPTFMAKYANEWETKYLSETNAIEDRRYTVFRGNSPLKAKDSLQNVNFQTWGEGSSMRFAAVGMSYPDDEKDGITEQQQQQQQQQRVEKQVWFATTSDPSISKCQDANERKTLLLQSFESWHDPIYKLIESTPADEILMERAVGHKHSTYPVFSVNEINMYQELLKQMKHSSNSSSSSDHDKSNNPPLLKNYFSINNGKTGPILLFLGDAAITVDPVLAQGFTIAMEGAADLARTLETCMEEENQTSSLSSKDQSMESLRPIIEKALRLRNERRYKRILCILRATELVQSMAQPRSGSLTGFLSTKLVRPIMKMIPNVLKEQAFRYVMKYSLGFYGSFSVSKFRRQLGDIKKMH